MPGVLFHAYTGARGSHVRWLRRLLLALAFSLLVGLVVGTLLRLRLERATPRWYIGALPLAPAPGYVVHPGPLILDPRHHEEQVGESVQPAETRRVERLAAV